MPCITHTSSLVVVHRADVLRDIVQRQLHYRKVRCELHRRGARVGVALQKLGLLPAVRPRQDEHPDAVSLGHQRLHLALPHALQRLAAAVNLYTALTGRGHVQQSGLLEVHLPAAQPLVYHTHADVGGEPGGATLPRRRLVPPGALVVPLLPRLPVPAAIPLLLAVPALLVLPLPLAAALTVATSRTAALRLRRLTFPLLHQLARAHRHVRLAGPQPHHRAARHLVHVDDGAEEAAVLPGRDPHRLALARAWRLPLDELLIQPAHVALPPVRVARDH
mmetsp:Transcript_40095/g.102607  ORF Transcript_40095/g.102607 Transcript_40095/m.102607 type:complete len:277 (-) Transcript_40095:430-1260(-)